MAQPPNPARSLRRINAIGNLLGASVAFLYFRVVDYAAADSPRVGLHEVAYSIVIFAALVGMGQWYNFRWIALIARAAAGESLTERETRLVRRRALLFPYFLAALTFAGW